MPFLGMWPQAGGCNQGTVTGANIPRYSDQLPGTEGEATINNASVAERKVTTAGNSAVSYSISSLSHKPNLRSDAVHTQSNSRFLHLLLLVRTPQTFDSSSIWQQSPAVSYVPSRHDLQNCLVVARSMPRSAAPKSGFWLQARYSKDLSKAIAPSAY